MSRTYNYQREEFFVGSRFLHVSVQIVDHLYLDMKLALRNSAIKNKCIRELKNSFNFFFWSTYRYLLYFISLLHKMYTSLDFGHILLGTPFFDFFWCLYKNKRINYKINSLTTAKWRSQENSPFFVRLSLPTSNTRPKYPYFA